MIAARSILAPDPGKPETYHFSCPVCAQPYRIRYDSAGRKVYDGRYDDYTCFIKEAPCAYCQTMLYLVYDADHLGVLAYDSAAEERRRRLADRHEQKRQQLKRMKDMYKRDRAIEFKEKRNRLQRKLKRLENKIFTRNEKYLEECRRMTIARRLEGSVPF
jgi:hypothetical protein